MTDTSITPTPAEPAVVNGAEVDEAAEPTLAQTITSVGDPDAYPPIRILALGCAVSAAITLWTSPTMAAAARTCR